METVIFLSFSGGSFPWRPELPKELRSPVRSPTSRVSSSNMSWLVINVSRSWPIFSHISTPEPDTFTVHVKYIIWCLFLYFNPNKLRKLGTCDRTAELLKLLILTELNVYWQTCFQRCSIESNSHCLGRSVRMSLGICPGVSSKFWRVVGSL